MVEGHLGKDKIQLLNQALNSASLSLSLAKQLLSEIERRGGASEMPGLVGKYDGMFMVTEAGKKYPVPDNYSAKTKLVYGDKLKMIEGPEGRRFKLLEEVEREEQEARLVVKDGRFEALGKGGSYRLIQGAVRYWGGQEGDKIKIILPKGAKNVPFAGLVEIFGRKPGAGVPETPKSATVRKEAPVEAPPRPEVKPMEKAPLKKEPAVKRESPKPKSAAKKASPKAGPTIKPEVKKEEPPKKVPKPLDEEELR
uniref:50S ribosomal protein L7/L12 n=1 Tax=candidate division WWE3 bacterium TaxID=2053526 RepID=A0A831YQ23_UNCKA